MVWERTCSQGFRMNTRMLLVGPYRAEFQDILTYCVLLLWWYLELMFRFVLQSSLIGFLASLMVPSIIYCPRKPKRRLWHQGLMKAKVPPRKSACRIPANPTTMYSTWVHDDSASHRCDREKPANYRPIVKYRPPRSRLLADIIVGSERRVNVDQ